MVKVTLGGEGGSGGLALKYYWKLGLLYAKVCIRRKVRDWASFTFGTKFVDIIFSAAIMSLMFNRATMMMTMNMRYSHAREVGWSLIGLH
jgi:hypothetical protein